MQPSRKSRSKANQTSGFRRWWDRARFFVGLRHDLKLALVGLAWSCVAILLAIITELSVLGITGALVGLIVSGLSVRHYEKEVNRQSGEVELVTRGVMTGTAPPGAVSLLTKNRLWLLYPELNAHLRRLDSTNAVEVKGSYVPPPEVGTIAPYVLMHKHRDAFNDAKLRFISPPNEIQSGAPAKFKNIGYFSYLCAGQFWSLRLKLDGTEVDMAQVAIDNSGVFRHYYDAPVAGHIVGISGLLLTRDGKLVIQKQLEKNADSPGAIVPSGSGSLDRTDGDRETLRDVLVEGALRECREELGMTELGVRAHTLLGMAVDSTRGLTTDFHVLLLSHLAFHEITNAYSFEQTDRRQKLVWDPLEVSMSSQDTAINSLREEVAKANSDGWDVLEVSLTLLLHAFEDQQTWESISALYRANQTDVNGPTPILTSPPQDLPLSGADDLPVEETAN